MRDRNVVMDGNPPAGSGFLVVRPVWYTAWLAFQPIRRHRAVAYRTADATCATGHASLVEPEWMSSNPNSSALPSAVSCPERGAGGVLPARMALRTAGSLDPAWLVSCQPTRSMIPEGRPPAWQRGPGK